MDGRPANTFLRKIEENARRILSSSAENNEVNHSGRQTCTPITIKEEDTSDEIQEYAATTMSELLGWYGYDKVDSGCTRSLNLDHFTSSPDARNSQTHQMDQKFLSSREIPKSSIPMNINTTTSAFEFPGSPLPYFANTLTMKRHFTSSPLSLQKVTLDSTLFPFTNFETSACSNNVMTCTWCGRITQRCESRKTNSLSYNMINTLGRFCSEACFAAGRRAVFKRAKTCDWCRHMRNPISYVDFQDGESQLQFCSDKCLNQYKMNIFCHETQTHLMLHGLNNISCHDTEKSSLITPELWFRSDENSLTEDTIAVDEHLSSNSSSSSHGKKGKEKEPNETEKSIEPNRKMTRKKDSFSIQKCIKTSNYNEKKNNFSTEMNESGIVNEHIKEQTLANEENKFCHFINNQSHYRVHCSEKNAINCKDLKKTSNLLDVTNYNSYNYQRNNTILLENNIHVNDIRNSQKEKEQDLSEETLRSTSCFPNSTIPTMQHKIVFPSKRFTDESSEMKYEKQANVTSEGSAFTPSMQSNQIESSIHSLPTTFLPPVTVLVPHPIPIPIPIPIPVPIPASLLNKLMAGDHKVFMSNKDSKHKNLECNGSIDSKCSVPDESQLNTDTNASARETKKHTVLSKLYSSPSSSDSKKDNDNVHPSKHNAKPLRKRKRSNEKTNYEHEELQLKRRNKFIAT